MPTSTAGENRQLLDQLVQLTEAVKRLAERPEPHPAADRQTEADRIRQRVAFGYQALGTLTGRVSRTGAAEFDVPVVAAGRVRGLIGIVGLPPDAGWVELRSGDKSEVVRIRRYERRDDREGITPRPGRTARSAPTGDAVEDAAEAIEEAVEEAVEDALEEAVAARFGRPWYDRDDFGVVRPERFRDTEPIDSVLVLRHRRGPLLAFGPRLPAVTDDRQSV
jgi:hypothetical protein